MPITRNGTERPREPLLQLNIVSGYPMCRIVRRLGSMYASIYGADVEIRTLSYLDTNSNKTRTLFGG